MQKENFFSFLGNTPSLEGSSFQNASGPPWYTNPFGNCLRSLCRNPKFSTFKTMWPESVFLCGDDDDYSQMTLPTGFIDNL